MRRTLFGIFFLIAATVAAVAQPRITSNIENHHFGQVEWKHPVTVSYTITNTGNEPLVLTNVVTSCACAVAEWTKEPIAPGEKGVIKATFDAKALGHFEKSVGIYSNADPHLLYLKFTGEVVTEIKDYAKSHPYEIGKIRIDKDEFSFPDARKGEYPTMSFSIVNLTDRPYRPVLMHLPPYLKMEAVPEVLLKGKKGTVKLTLDTKQLTDYGRMQASVYLSRFAGDKVNEENEIPVSAVLLPDFSHLSRQDSLNAPTIQVSATELDAREALAKKRKATYKLTVTNTGKSPLQIQKLQIFNLGVSVSLKKKELLPGQMTTMKIVVRRPEEVKKHRKRDVRILMITNDPLSPKVEITVKR